MELRNLCISVIAISLFLSACKEDKSSTMSSESVAVPAQYVPCTDNALNVLCYTSAARYIYPTLYGGRSATGTNVSGASGNLTATIPIGWYNGGQTASMSDTNLVPQNIRLGATLFGVIGNFTQQGADFLGSSIHRNKATTQLTILQETTTYSGNNTLPVGYRLVPSIFTDDDGFTGGSVSYVDRTMSDNSTSWANLTCGIAPTTLAGKIADCVSIFGSKATWDGSARGNAGQAIWKLVSRTGNVTSSKGRELWLDTRTNLLWSSLVSTSLNWCKATGNNASLGNPLYENDPSGTCSNSSYQATSGNAVSACYEASSFTSIDANIDNTGKAGLALGTTPAIAWRIPTAYDYKQAEVDGIRFVLPDITSGSAGEWTGTVFSSDRTKAWYFDGTYGGTSASVRTQGYSVRCVGR